MRVCVSVFARGTLDTWSVRTVVACGYSLGSGTAQRLERRTRDRRSRVRVPAGAAGEFSSPGSTFCADS